MNRQTNECFLEVLKNINLFDPEAFRNSEI